MQNNVSHLFHNPTYISLPIPKASDLAVHHKLLKNPSFSELNKKISDYPSSPPLSIPTTRPPSRSLKATIPSSTSRERLKAYNSDLNHECTFQPKINFFKAKENASIPLKEKIKILSKPKTESFNKRELIKRKHEIEEALMFKYSPEINKYKNIIKIPITERIYEENLKAKEREKLKRMEQEKIIEECTFHPKINVKNKSQVEPIFKRSESVELTKLKNLIKIKNEMDKKLSFSPIINKRSRALSASGRSSQKYLNLNRDPLFLQYSRNKQSVDLDSVNQICIPSRNFHDFSEFFHRQKRFQDKKNTEVSQMQSDREGAYSFRPAVNKNSSFLVETAASPLPILQKMHKLSQDNLRKTENQQKIRENFYSNFKFVPEINKISQQIGRKSSLDELSKNHSKQSIKKSKEDHLLSQKIENCTFSPDIISKSKFSHIQSSYSQTQKILQNIAEENKRKSERIRQEKYSKDYEELKNCSFKPEIHENKPNQIGKYEIKGLDRYFELKTMANKLFIERESQKNIFTNFSSHHRSSTQDFM